MSELDLSEIDRIVERAGRGPGALIAILQAIQERCRYLPREALERVCAISEITPAAIAGVSTFYGQFRHEPVGEHIVRICHGTACHVKGSALVEEKIRAHLGIPEGRDTDPKGLFTLQSVACLGCCTLAPVVEIDGVTYGHVAARGVRAVFEDFLARSREGSARRARRVRPAEPAEGEVRIGLGSCCVAGGSAKVERALEDALASSGARAAVKRVGCVGMCHRTPLVQVARPGEAVAFYANVGPEAAEAIVRRHFRPQGALRKVFRGISAGLRRLLAEEDGKDSEPCAVDLAAPEVAPFFARQVRIATEGCGEMDPLDLAEYIARGGFRALQRSLKELSAEQVIAEIEASGLRGRGGAGFPTGAKWRRVRDAEGTEKYAIANGDEGDPGAFMDRMLMESYPYRVLEGMAIAAAAIGAERGYLYIRAEYPLAVRRIREAIRRAEERGILGGSAMGTGRALRFEVFEGAGAFVCGEETALLASIEGRRGMPRLRPPYPAESGLWGKPTLVNNVETFAVVPWILRNGAERFAALGTRASKGTKVFALSGKIARGGLIEVPMGITVREIVEEIGGGVAGGRSFKAVQVGGPSGGCIPAELADTPVDYEALARVGAIMGSGGFVVLDDATCMVDVARYFLEFTQDQSCGKCTFCRIGTRRMLEILVRISEGKGRRGDLEDLEDLARTVQAGSLCGLGRTAPNPVITTLRYFRSEYEAHFEGRCPAKRCRALIAYRVTDACTGCTLCAQRCPAEAIALRPYQKHEIDLERCTRCDACRAACPAGAIEVVDLADAREAPAAAEAKGA